MAEFTIHTIESAPEGSRETLRAAAEKFGFLPNLLGELAAAPAAVKAYVTLNGLLEETSFTPLEQQLLLASISVANRCHYCVAAHTAGLKQAALPDHEIEAVREGRRLADPKLETLRLFAVAVVEGRGHVDDGDLQAFLDVGYRREQVFEVLLAVAMKTLSNYTNHIAETPLDRELGAFAWEAEEPAGARG